MADPTSDPQIGPVIARLIERARASDAAVTDAAVARMAQRAEQPSGAEVAAELREALMPVDLEEGRLLYALALARRPRLVVELGTSHGVSTLFLAGALRDLGGGRVVSAELLPEKAAVAREALAAAGVGDLVEVREGDGRETLAELPGPVDLVFLDAWQDTYDEVLSLLEPRLAEHAIVVVADVEPRLCGDLLARLRNPSGDYVSVPLPFARAHVELAVYTRGSGSAPVSTS